MENIKYYFNDEVTTVSSTGVVKYGHILSTEILQSDTKFSNSTKISNINVYWHPNGPKELISTDKVTNVYSISSKFIVIQIFIS